MVDDLASGVSLLFKNHHITHVVGRGALWSAESECHRVEVVGAEGTLQMSAKRVVLATGSQARQVSTLTVDGERIITAREALSLAEVPKHLLVVWSHRLRDRLVVAAPWSPSERRGDAQ